MSKKHSNNLLAVLDAKNGTRIRCAFHYCLRPAWTLSKRNFVELDVENHDYAPLLTILSRACGRNLNVHVGAIGSVAGALGQRSEFDHALIIPPIGLRQKFGPPLMSHFVGMKAEDLTAESFAALWGASLGRERNVVVVGNGMLFRRSGMGTAFKRGLIERQGLEAVVSLPRGIFPGTSIGVSALVFSGDGATRSRRETMRFINGSDPAALGPAPLSKLLSNKSTDPLCVDASIREVSEGGFNLLVDRYVWDPAVQIHREMLNQHETVRLADLADIHGPQNSPASKHKRRGTRSSRGPSRRRRRRPIVAAGKAERIGGASCDEDRHHLPSAGRHSAFNKRSNWKSRVDHRRPRRPERSLAHCSGTILRHRPFAKRRRDRRARSAIQLPALPGCAVAAAGNDRRHHDHQGGDQGPESHAGACLVRGTATEHREDVSRV